MGSRSRDIFRERGAHCKVYGFSAVSYAKTAEPIDLPFGLWIRVGRRKHTFNRVRQVVQCTQVQSNSPDGANVPDDTTRLSFLKWLNRSICRRPTGCMHSGVPKEAQIQSYSQGGTNVPSSFSWKGTNCCHLAKTIELSVCGGDAGLVKLLDQLLQRAQCSHCKRCISYGNSVCPSVRPSVTRRYCVKTTARITVQFAPLDSKMCLVL